MKLKIKPLYIALVIVVIGIISGIGYMAANTPEQTVEVGDIIKVDYTGTLTNGTQFDSSVGREPLQFEVGSGDLIKGFDNGVVGMKLNEEKTVTIPAEEAYGEKISELIMQIPLSSFGGQNVQAGMTISGAAGGQRMQGVVIEVDSTTATVDFNHPLAGQTLIFKIKVVDIQKRK